VQNFIKLSAAVYVWGLQFSTENFDTSQFAKFHGLPLENCPNSTARHSLPFLSKLSSILFGNFSYWMVDSAPLC